MSEKNIWVFGNAVQDITLDLIDLDRLAIEYENIPDKIRLDGNLKLHEKLWIYTRIGFDLFKTEMQFSTGDSSKGPNKDSEDFYPLIPGGKYQLSGSVQKVKKDAWNSDDGLFVPCENMLWGGGGLNCTTFLRSLIPDTNTLPIIYTDVAMSRTLHIFIKKLQSELDKAIKNAKVENLSYENLYSIISDLMSEQPAITEELASDIASIVSKYSPLRSLEVYLASLPVNSLLYRPDDPSFRRNIIFSRVRSSTRSMDDKIVCKGKQERLNGNDKDKIYKLLKGQTKDIGVFLFNSLADKAMFKASYDIYLNAISKDKNVVGILAMTKTMRQIFLDCIKSDDNNLPPFILVFNEKEAYEFARVFCNDVKPFVEYPGDMPNIVKFAKIAIEIRNLFNFEKVAKPRIYVTIGDRGSLGIEFDGSIVYVWRYSKPRASIYDTNACGDAFCAGISLMEWAKRRDTKESISGVNIAKPGGPIMEMRYFMAVASAAAYAKASNRRGRVDGTEVMDLLEHSHFASVFLPNVEIISELIASDNLPEGVGKDNRLKIPVSSERLGVTLELRKLMGIGD